MATPDCFQSLDAVAIRVARLTATGAPQTGAGNAIVSNAQIKVDVDFDMAKGDDLEQKNGSGAICAAFTDVDRMKHVNLAMDLCTLDSQLMELLTSSSVFTSGGNPIGGQFPAVGADPNAGVCFEVWTKAWDNGAPAFPTITSPSAAYIHWVFPKTRWFWQKFTLEHGFTVFPVSGIADENPRITANGPFNDWPAAITGPGGVTRCGGWFFDSTIPTVSCGYTTVTSAAS